jgi:hypothetical protein
VPGVAVAPLPSSSAISRPGGFTSCTEATSDVR